MLMMGRHHERASSAYHQLSNWVPGYRSSGTVDHRIMAVLWPGDIFVFGLQIGGPSAWSYCEAMPQHAGGRDKIE